MNKPILTWYIEDESNKLTPYEEFYAGTLTPNQRIKLKILLWNNRWGDEDVEDLSNPYVYIYFDNIEDEILLNMCKLSIDEKSYIPLNVESGQGIIQLNRVIYGKSNNGSLDNENNYCILTIEIGPIKEGMKNALKNLYIAIDDISL